MSTVTTKSTWFRTERTVSADIRAPPEHIWAFLTTAERHAVWNSAVPDIRGPITVGSRLAMKVPGSDRTYRPTVTAFEVPRRMVWRGSAGPLFDSTMTFTLTPKAPGVTEFALSQAFDGLVLPLLGRSLPDLSEVLERYAADLKSAAEAGRIKPSWGVLDRGRLVVPRKLHVPSSGPRHSHPVLLVPVRLETRFVDSALKVRIYPDQLSIETHEQELTQSELTAGRTFMSLYAQSEELSTAELSLRRREAWRELIAQFGSRRSSWILRTVHLYPENFDVTLLRRESWASAPTVRLLPDRFLISIYRGGQHVPQYDTVTSATWSELAVMAAPPSDDPAPPAPDALPPDLFDENSRWVVDFEDACAKGMAVSIPLHKDHPPPFSHVIAVGIDSSRTPTEGADLLESVLDSHHYTDGLAFVRYGTPTNNTVQAKSGQSETTDDADKTYAVEVGGSSVTGSLSNAERLRFALGLAAASDPPPNAAPLEQEHEHVFQRVALATDTRESYVREVHRLLWAATGGHYLHRMLGGAVPPAMVVQVRDHFVNHVRGRGPLPAMRIGQVPYGVLPVTRLPTERPVFGLDDALAGDDAWFDAKAYWIAARLGDRWLARANQPRLVPRIRKTSEDPDAELLGILSMEPECTSCRQRPFVDERFVGVLLAALRDHFFGPGTPFGSGVSSEARVREWIDEWVESRQPAAEILASLGANRENALATPLFRIFAWADGTPCDDALATGAVAALKQLCGGALNWAADQESLFTRLLSYSYELDPEKEELREIACRLSGRESAIVANLAQLTTPGAIADYLWEAHGSDLGMSRGAIREKATTYHAYRRQKGKAAVRTTKQVANVLGVALGTIADVDYDGLLRETLDLCSHRLDAWLTSFATKRLMQMREAADGSEGVYIGAYGWVEDLAPAEAADPNLAPGHIHAPSIAQASTAAVLRNAFLTHYREGQDNPFKVDITSERVRKAHSLLEGVRQGQPLGAILGYHFERSLHDAELDRHIDDLRNMYPLVAHVETAAQAADEPAEFVAARNVVDGLALVRSPRSEGPLATFLDSVPEIEILIDSLAEALDGMTDLLVAESLFQATQANYDRAGAALEAAAGAAGPPEVHFTETRPPGITQAHRVCILLPAPGPNELTPEPACTKGPRACAEPRLEAWFASILGPLSTITCRARYGSDGDVLVSMGIALDPGAEDHMGLELDAIDFVLLSAQAADGAETEIERLIAYRIRAHADLPADTAVEVDFGRDAGNIGDAMEVGRSIRAVVSATRALCPDDIRRPEDLPRKDSEGGDVSAFAELDFDELGTRLLNARVTLRDGVVDVLTSPDSGLDEVVAALLLASRFSIQGAIPTAPDEPNLAERKASVLAQANARLDASGIGSGEGLIEDRRLEFFEAAFRALLGDNFRILPVFELEEMATLRDSFADNGQMTEAVAADEVPLWMHQLAETHRPIRHLERLLAVQQAWSPSSAIPAPSRLRVAQLPFDQNLAWQALPDAEDAPSDSSGDAQALSRPRGTLSVVALAADHTALASIAGLLVDSWTETIPLREVSTGVSFQYDAPSSQAPSALLLAVPERVRAEGWTESELRDIVRDTTKLTRIRMVDPDALHTGGTLEDGFAPLGRLFPAAFLPSDPARPGWQRAVDLPDLAEWKDLVQMFSRLQ